MKKRGLDIENICNNTIEDIIKIIENADLEHLNLYENDLPRINKCLNNMYTDYFKGRYIYECIVSDINKRRNDQEK